MKMYERMIRAMNAIHDVVYRDTEYSRPFRLPFLRGDISSKDDSSNSNKIGTCSCDEGEGKDDEGIKGVLDGVVGDSITSSSQYSLRRGDTIDTFILQHSLFLQHVR
mmetsp:Transcript_13022/g.14265  ORF Transcript_13022/g.14265 Transcript_13022/m.14265 type:complete len:107 (+) Transcript_13022:1874-2194(+)